MISDRVQQSQRAAVSPRARIKILEQMVGALETEVEDLSRRAMAFDEEERLLNRASAKHQAEVERLSARLNAVRSERDELLNRIKSMTSNALAMREEVSNNEDELAIEALHGPPPRVVAAGSRARRVTNGRRWRDKA